MYWLSRTPSSAALAEPFRRFGIVRLAAVGRGAHDCEIVRRPRIARLRRLKYQRFAAAGSRVTPMPFSYIEPSRYCAGARPSEAARSNHRPAAGWSFGTPRPSNRRVASSYCALGWLAAVASRKEAGIPGGIVAMRSPAGRSALRRKVEPYRLARRLSNRSGRRDIDRFATRPDRAGAVRGLALRRLELGGVDRLSTQFGALQKWGPNADHSHGEGRRDHDGDTEQYGAPVTGVERPCGLDAPRPGRRPLGTGQGLNVAAVEFGARFPHRRLRGPTRGGDVDSDRRVGPRPDNLSEVASFARALGRASAGLDQEVLAVGRLKRPIFRGRSCFGRGRALRRAFVGQRLDAWQWGADRRDGARRSGWRPQLLVDVLGRKFALNALETRSQRLEDALQIREPRLRALVRTGLFDSRARPNARQAPR